MLDILFLSKDNNHGRYFKKLSSQIPQNSQVVIFGRPIFSALKNYKKIKHIVLDDIIKQQLRKKAIKHPWLFASNLIQWLYSHFIRLIESCRAMKYIALFNQLSPRSIAVWNGQKLPASTLVEVAKYMHIKVWYFENGLLPNTTSLDPQGVNAANSLPRNPEFYLSQNLKPLALPEIAVRKSHKKRKKGESITLPERFIFVPFQVPNDTQILCHSSWIDSMETLFEQVVEAFSQVADEDLHLVFKEHPSWAGHFTGLYNQDSRFIFANDNHTPDLIAAAEAVITINSSVGLEALINGKRVITLGDSCYNIDGLVLHCNNQSSLVEALNNYSNWLPSSELREAFLQFLFQVYCIPTRWHECDDSNVAKVADRFQFDDRLSQSLEEQPQYS